MTATGSQHECLNTRQLLKLAEGQLTSGEAARFLGAIEQCPDCMVLLSEAGLAIAQEAGDVDGEEPDGLVSSGLLGATLASRYRIDRRLGRGGMGEVYEARDLELDERVALKTVLPRLARKDPVLLRFKREVRFARQIVHPNVCRVLELGKEGEGDEAVYFLTMELLEGETLSQKLKRDGALAPQLVTELGVQLCAGLGAIHRAGVLHRDIKPSNIMLQPPERPNGDFVATLLDFGIARALAGFGGQDASDAGAPAEQPLTSTWTSQSAVGTPHYMAPEQISGGTLSVATDLYSLGVVLGEMCTGKRPSRRDEYGHVAGDVSAELDGLIAWCLRADPACRPRSAEELQEALLRLTRRQAIGESHEASPSTSRLVRTWFSRHVAAVTFGILAMGALALFSRFLTFSPPAFRARPAPAQKRALLDSEASNPTTSAAPPTAESTSGGAALETLPPNSSGPDSRRHRTSSSGGTPLERNIVRVPSSTGGASEPHEPARSKSAQAVADNCTPPYFFDDEGIKTFRKECL